MSDFYKKELYFHIAIVLLMISVVFVAAYCLREKTECNAISFLKPRSDNAAIIKRAINTGSIKEKRDLDLLQNLSLMIENRKEEKKLIFITMYKYYFASTTILLCLSTISVIVVYLVLQTGIKEANPYLKTVFFSLAALTSFYALSPKIYKQESNINKNLNAYLAYDNLQQDIYNYAMTNDAIKIDTFHKAMIKSMNQINTLDLEFDTKSIVTPDFKLNRN